MDLKQLASAIEQIAEEKNIPAESVLETVETALAAAYKRDYGDRGQNVRVDFNLDTGEMTVYQVFAVVDETMVREVSMPSDEGLSPSSEGASDPVRSDVSTDIGTTSNEVSDSDDEEEDERVRFNPQRHMMAEEAQKIDASAEVGGDLLIELEPPDEEFGRIAAQTAKQVIIQRLREIERDVVFDEYKEKEGEVVSGVVQRIEGGLVFVDIGRAAGVLYPDEQIPGERYSISDRLRVYLDRVERGARGASIILSRAHANLVRELFTIEVPEVSAGTVDIKSVAREPGSRSKISVWTDEDGVDPVGSLVGQKGTRVQTVIAELGGEKIDIIEWDPDEATYIANSLSPAKVLYVDLDESFRSASAVVADDQLSLAIGRKGQNVRLAAKLTGWRIDIKSEEEMSEEAERRKRALRGEDSPLPNASEEQVADERGAGEDDISLEDLPGIGAKTAEALQGTGFTTIADIAAAAVEDLSAVEGIGPATAKKVREAAQEMLNAPSDD